MLFNIIIFFLVLITLILLLRDTSQESFISNSGGIPVPSHQQYVESSQQKFNNVSNLINLADPSIAINSDTPSQINVALETIGVKPNSGAFEITGINTKTNIPSKLPSNFQLAKMCEAQATASCSAFDNSDFAANCGVSFDTKGRSFTGKPHIGGMFISDTDRQQQLQKMGELEAAGQDGYTAFKPTLGSAKSGSFALTKDQCVVVKERIECQAKQTFNSPNCTQCYTSSSFHRVDPSTGRLPSKLRLFGNGNFSFTLGNMSTINGSLSPQKANEIEIPADAEGKQIIITISNDNKSGGKPAYILGFIEGQTPRGTFKLDLMSLIETDLVSSAKPKISGANIVDGFRAFVLLPGTGQITMKLSGLIPFSFLSLYDSDARTCDNGPIITQAASATFLESDPCFNKKNKPGNYTLDCLQERWMELGGTAQGTGYPNTQDKANTIQIDGNGNPLNIDTIVNNLYPKMTQASTGLNTDGSPLTISQWNTISMWGLGVPISTPCDGMQGQVSPRCLEYLYLNQGAQSHIGATYTLPTSDSSLKGSINGSNTYCQPGAPLDPSTSTGKQYIQTASQNGIQAVKSVYDQIHRSANDNTLSNEARKQAVDLCYGVNMDVLNTKSGNYMGSAIPSEVQPILIAIYGSNPDIAFANNNIFNNNINWQRILQSYTIYDTALTPAGILISAIYGNIFNNSSSYWGVGINNPYNSSSIIVFTPNIQFQQIATDGIYVCGVDINTNPWYAKVQTLVSSQSANSFIQLPSVLTKILPYNGNFICLGLDQLIWYLTPPFSGWVQVPVNTNWTFKDLAVDGYLVVFIGMDNNLYYTNQNLVSSGVSANLILMPPGIGAQSVSLSKESIAFVDTNGNYWFCSNYASPKWQQITGSGGVKIRHRIPS